jgi:HEAT repeat protein
MPPKNSVIKTLRILLLLFCIHPRLFAEAQPSIKDLIHQLNSGDIDEKERAAKALGDLGPAAKPAIGALQNALNDELPYVRIHSAEALAKIGPAALPALIAAMKNVNAEVRSSAATGIGNSGENSDAAVSTLAKALHDKELQVRGAAALALVNLASSTPSALAALQEATHDADALVAAKAKEALTHVNAVTIGKREEAPHVAVSTQPAKVVIPRVVRPATTKVHPAAPKKKPAPVVLKIVKKRKAPPTPAELLVQLQSSTDSVKASAEQALVQRSTETTPLLIQSLQGGDTTLAELSAVVLQKIATADAKNAVDAYRKRQSAKTLASLLKNLRQEGPASDEAQSELVKLGAPAVSPVSQVLSDPRPTSRRAAAKTLNQLGALAAPATPQLINALDDSDAGVRAESAEALRKIHTPEAEKALRFFPIKDTIRGWMAIFKK